jgi:4-amino-4-deoxy-L-arabinose transferase-like glycosyltransferase
VSRRQLEWVCHGLSAVLLLVLCGLVVRTFGDYGLTLDEEAHALYGDRLLSYFQRGLSYDDELYTWYPGGYDVLAAAYRRVSALGSYDALHLMGGCVGVLGVVGVWQLGRALLGPIGAFVAALLCATTPVYYGHMFNNPKDLPFAVAYVWSLYAIVRLVQQLPRPSWRWSIAAGVAIGAAMSVRIAGLLLLVYLALVLFAYALHRGWHARSVAVGGRLLQSAALRLATAAAVAWGVLLLAWPWAVLEPLRRPLAALSQFSEYTAHSRPMPYGERIIDTARPAPVDYIPRYLALKLPDVVWVLLVLGAALGIWCVLARARSRAEVRRTLALAVVGLAGALPPLYAVARGSSLYDGLRHVLFLVPVACVIAAGAAVMIGYAARRRHALLAVAVGLVVALGCADAALSMRSLHPHEYIYFNRASGGLSAADGRYSTNYYGGDYREAFEQLQHYLWRTEPDAYLDRDYVLTGCFNGEMVPAYLPPNFSRGPEADFSIDFTRADCHLRHADRPEVLRVQRQGVGLVIVRDLRTEAP